MHISRNHLPHWQEIDVCSKPTERITRLRECFILCEPKMCCDRAMIYTQAYREHENKPIVLKRALALKATLENLPIFIWEDELIAGHPAAEPRSAEVFPDINFSIMREIDQFETREYNRLNVSLEVKRKLHEIQPFWEGRTPHDRFMALRPVENQQAIDAGLISNPHEWSGLAHVSIDYERILKKGISGILADIDAYQARAKKTDQDYADRIAFYEACRALCEGILRFAARYRQLALQLSKTALPQRRVELEQMAAVLEKVPLKPAGSFAEAVQSFWIIQVIPYIEENGYSISPGRFDQYMFPYLQSDLSSGHIDLPAAQELLDNLFLKFCEVLRVDSTAAAEINAGYASGQNLEVGGMDVDGNDATNLLSVMCLAANHHIHLHQPNFTARLHEKTPDEFLIKAIDSISCGNGMPQLLNDELIIKSLVRHGMSLAEARNYLPVGCDEITVARHWGRCNGGYVNFAKVLEVTISGGQDLLRKLPAGLKQNQDAIASFADFRKAFFAQLENAVQMQVCEANLTDSIHKDLVALPFLSLFLDDCLERGKDVTAGGGHYNTTGMVGVGSATCGDSLYAIRKLVFEDGKLSIAQLLNLLESNFAGQEALRQFIINRMPKFGNDIDEVDNLVCDVTNHYFDELEKYRNQRGGDFWPALYSVSAQVGLGNSTAATPDGRLAALPLSDGLTPMYGLDRKGPTASLRSVAKVALERAPNGVIVNQRLLANLFRTQEGRQKMALLLRSFVKVGGFHWQFNIVDNETLIDAQKNPDKYRGLVIRVAGYSAIFIELSKKAQDSIIHRYSANIE